MSIIDKLGIKLNEDGCHQFKSEEIYKSVKDAAPEMLEALIENTMALEILFEKYRGEIYYSNIVVIENATGKSWKEIKALL